MIIFIPGCVITALQRFFFILTFPGVVLHEMSHKFFCDLYQIPVFDVKYFSTGKKAGYVLHSTNGSVRNMAMIGFAPLFVNSTVCFLFLLPLLLPEFIGTSFVSTYTWPDLFLFWIGFSCGVHALPSAQDLAHIDQSASWQFIWGKRLIQLFNWAGLLGDFFWMALFSIVPLFALSMLCHVVT